jgi:hypothetical protein
MPPVLVSDPGAVNANTFASLAEYKIYISTRRPQLTWFTAALAGTTIDDELTIDLLASAPVLNSSFDWTGTISPANLSDSLLWPREEMYYRNGNPISSLVNPTDLKNAQCELAIQMHSADLISDNEVQKQGISAVKAGSVEVKFQNRDISSAESADIDIRRRGSQFNYLSDSIPRMVRLLLVPSWYREAESGLSRSFIFEVM